MSSPRLASFMHHQLQCRHHLCRHLPQPSRLSAAAEASPICMALAAWALPSFTLILAFISSPSSPLSATASLHELHLACFKTLASSVSSIPLAPSQTARARRLFLVLTSTPSITATSAFVSAPSPHRRLVAASPLVLPCQLQAVSFNAHGMAVWSVPPPRHRRSAWPFPPRHRAHSSSSPS